MCCLVIKSKQDTSFVSSLHLNISIIYPVRSEVITAMSNSSTAVKSIILVVGEKWMEYYKICLNANFIFIKDYARDFHGL